MCKRKSNIENGFRGLQSKWFYIKRWFLDHLSKGTTHMTERVQWHNKHTFSVTDKSSSQKHLFPHFKIYGLTPVAPCDKPLGGCSSTSASVELCRWWKLSFAVRIKTKKSAALSSKLHQHLMCIKGTMYKTREHSASTLYNLIPSANVKNMSYCFYLMSLIHKGT